MYQTYLGNPLNPHPGENMVNRIVKWMLRIVNRRICSVDEFCAILRKMENNARYDKDGFISIGDAIRLLIGCFKAVRNGVNE